MKSFQADHSKNIIGKKIVYYRKNHQPPLTQKELSDKLRGFNVHLDRYAISRIESGDRFVADYEIVALAHALNVTPEELLL